MKIPHVYRLQCNYNQDGFQMQSFDHFNGDINAYLDALRDPVAMWGFLHIAKTAGSSLISELNKTFPPYYNIYAEYKLGGERDYYLAMGNAIERFFSAHRIRPQRCFSGHISMSEAIAIRKILPGSRFFTFLRDPAERVVSQYRYSLTASDPNHVLFSSRYSTIEQYVADPISQNLIHKVLSPWPGATAEETADYAIDFFDFIGLTEMYRISASIIFDIMGNAHVPTETINVTDQTRANTVDLTAPLRARIMEHNNSDYLIYNKLRHVILPILEHFK